MVGLLGAARTGVGGAGVIVVVAAVGSGGEEVALAEEEAEGREVGVRAYRRWGGRRLVGVERW